MIYRLLFASLAVFVTAYIIPGVSINPWWVSIIVAVVMGLLNSLVRPVLAFISAPLSCLTLGLWSFVLNALMVMLCAYLVDGFTSDGFWSALIFSLVLTAVNWVLNMVFSE